MIWNHRITPIATLNAPADGNAAKAVWRATQTLTTVGHERRVASVSSSAT
jgi:inosine-uridine nucleoside N-ribohydrolase